MTPESDAVEKFKDRIRGLTHRTRPMHVAMVIRDLLLTERVRKALLRP
ncbi:hypothetical protein [Sulfobacillus sp. hq2]|nr:hypothetical protein [Sulfobacillus sp. hq2]